MIIFIFVINTRGALVQGYILNFQERLMTTYFLAKIIAEPDS